MVRLLLSFWSILFLFTSQLQGQTAINIDSLIELEEYEVANQLLKQIQAENLAKKDYKTFLSTSISISENLNNLDFLDTAITNLKNAVAIAQPILAKDSLLAVAFHKLAILYYSNLEDKLAINYWEKALGIRELIFDNHHLEIIKTYRNLGNSFINLEKWEEGRKNLQKSLDLHLTRTDIDEVILSKTYNDLGKVYTIIENYNEAEKYLSVALENYKKLFADEPWLLSYAYENVFFLNKIQEDYEQMIKSQKEILEKYLLVEEKWEDDYIALANIYNNLGLGYDLMDSLIQATRYYKLSLNINQKHVAKNNSSLAINYNNLAKIYSKQNQFHQAIESIDIAIDFDLKSNNQTGFAIDLNVKALILRKQGKLKKSLQTIEKSIKALQSKKQNLVLDKPLLITILNDKLTIQKSLSKKDTTHLQAATKTIQQIIILTQELRTGYQSDASKSFLAKKAKATFENAIELYLALYKNTQDKKHLTDAFQIAEQAKSIILMDAVQQAQAKNTVEVPVELLEKETDLKRQIAQKEKALFLKEADENILNNELIILNRSLEKLTDTLKTNYPKYHAAKYATALPNIATIFQEIDGNLLEFFVGDHMIYAFLLNKEKQDIQVTEIPLDFPLTDWIKQLRVNIYRPFLQKVRSDEVAQKMADDLVQVAYQLHQKLIAPVIGSQTLAKELTIVPDGVLGYIPFDVLISSPPTESSLFGIHDYLLKQYQINYGYSAALLLEMKNKSFSKIPTEQFVAFAPEFKTENAAAFAQDIEAVRGDLDPLAFNTPEVEALQKLVGGQVFIGEKASKTNFLQYAPTSKILHLATHGKANDEAGDYAFLAFTDVDGEAASKLYNRDLYNLDLSAEMVVLSACETGIGELQKGEGIISLARGFSYAGAKSIITTLWSINDARTKELMEYFYTYLKNGQTKDAALRQAKLDFLDKYSHNAHPFYWAAFIPIGDMQAITFSTPTNWWRFGSIFLIGLGLFFLFIKFRKKN